MGSIGRCRSMFRVGGDEFVVLVPNLDSQAEVEALADRLVESAREPISLAGRALVPGVNIGIGLFPQHGRTTDALLAASDEALYAAKTSGRNRCSVALGRRA